jgi:transcription elongation factor GreB
VPSFLDGKSFDRMRISVVEWATRVTKNYITPRGWKVLITELTELVTVERPRVVREVSDAAAEGDRSENAAYIYGKRRLREIDRRAGFLQRRLAIAQVVDGRKQSRERVFFGALVEVEDEDGQAVRYQVVGVDEIDAKAGRVSWQSPLGKALLGKKLGDTARVRWHVGERELEVVSIDYLDDPPPGDMAAVIGALGEAAAPEEGEAGQQEQREQKPRARRVSRRGRAR